MARVSIDVKNVGESRSFVFAVCEDAEHADAIVQHRIEGAPLAMALLTWSREEGHLVF